MARLTYERSVLIAILALTAVKLAVAATTPLAFDEALHWRYSRHLAFDYIDHPFMNALMVRLGTWVVGDTPLGVRLLPVLGSLPASWAVWRGTKALFDDKRLAATAALWFNLTVTMLAGSIIATTDQAVVVAAAFLLYAAAGLARTGRGAWWLAIGAAMGLGLDCKYTMVFFAPGLLLWLLFTPELRRWLVSPWPWAGAALAVALFSPVIWWNAQHHWASVVYQSGRLAASGYSARYGLELLGAMVVLATPPIFVLAAIGVGESVRDRASATTLLVALMAPLLIYFFVHALHERVQGNWPEPVYPALAVLAAWAGARLQGRTGALGLTVRWSSRLVVPFGLACAAFLYVEAPTGIVPLGTHDPRARVLGVGWPALAERLEQARRDTGLQPILTSNYILAGWGAFYMPGHDGIEQIDQRLRWDAEPPPDPTRYRNGALYICTMPCKGFGAMAARFRSVTLIDTLYRPSAARPGAVYRLYALCQPIAPVFDAPTVLPVAD